jgi:hypothetical protein
MKTAKIPCKEGSRDFELTSIESVVLNITGIGFSVLSNFPYLVQSSLEEQLQFGGEQKDSGMADKNCVSLPKIQDLLTAKSLITVCFD